MKRNLLIAVLIVGALLVVLWLANNVFDLVGFIKQMHGG